MHNPDYAAMTLADGLLRRHEGLKLKPYQCTAGKLTIGVGRNLEARGISQDEAELMLANDIELCEQDLANFYWWNALSARRKAALIDLRFCVGPAGFRKFRKMIAAIEAHDWSEAADQILDSAFANQTGHRAIDLADLMTQG